MATYTLLNGYVQKHMRLTHWDLQVSGEDPDFGLNFKSRALYLEPREIFLNFIV